MKAIKTKYLGPTNTKGARIVVADKAGNRKIYPFDHEIRNPHRKACQQFCKDLGWSGTLAEGSLRNENVYVFVVDWMTFRV